MNLRKPIADPPVVTSVVQSPVPQKILVTTGICTNCDFFRDCSLKRNQKLYCELYQ